MLGKIIALIILLALAYAGYRMYRGCSSGGNAFDRACHALLFQRSAGNTGG